MLVVDDQATIRGIVSTVLDKLGYGPITTARTGREGLERMREAKPIIVVSDINMPEMNGLEMLKMVRTGKSDAPRGLPVVMLTAHSEAVVVGTALQLDASGFVVKPAAPKDLDSRIARALAKPLVAKPVERYAQVQVPEVDSYGVVAGGDLARQWQAISGEAPPSPLPRAQLRAVTLAQLTIGQTLGDWVATQKQVAPVLCPRTVITEELMMRLADLVEVGAIPDSFALIEA